MPDENKSPILKKSKLGLIGFILAIVGYIGFGALTLFPALIICIIAFFRKSNQILVVIGFLLCSFWLTYLVEPDICFPNPYGVSKFAQNLNVRFWLGFDPMHMKNAQGAYWFFGGSGGAIYFTSKSATYNSQDIIKYAQNHGWKYKRENTLLATDFDKFVDSNNEVPYLDRDDYFKSTADYDDDEYESVEKLYKLESEKVYIIQNASMRSFPFWIRSDCDVLLFDTNNRTGALSSVFISKDGKSLAVYYNGSR